MPDGVKCWRQLNYDVLLFDPNIRGCFMFVFSRYETGPFVSFISTAKYCSRFHKSSNRGDNRVQWYLQSNISIVSNILHPDIRWWTRLSVAKNAKQISKCNRSIICFVYTLSTYWVVQSKLTSTPNTVIDWWIYWLLNCIMAKLISFCLLFWLTN